MNFNNSLIPKDFVLYAFADNQNDHIPSGVSEEEPRCIGGAELPELSGDIWLTFIVDLPDDD